MRNLVFIVSWIFLLSACGGNHDYSPKPRGYFRIPFPPKAYQTFDTAGCPFTFLYPKYAHIEPDHHKGAKPCWLNVKFPQFNGTLHLTYEHLSPAVRLDTLTEHAHKYAFKNTIKATSIDEGAIYYPDRKLYGIYYTIDGNAASSAQFYFTDSTKNYLRAALYFYNEPRIDSIQPVLNFIKKDMNVMIGSFRWKK
ncbi:gliding motility lipoprotein GldD [Mucilaginibacter sp. PPCGB 2223]|uniref:gliding motility lipoprotein GldD n=1 Tax=Mucilaginibacter sp. PPCGB 2223 TaxID=1886027 RepID=UPI000825CDBA|nr:gliding motility lipoprotein GldD [Mucilaginibacter sp. PPCGB 2223]OCX50987.1 gliding motility lipoprotein GldD [Mucilaginibacter sp. PPCGB 2223]